MTYAKVLEVFFMDREKPHKSCRLQHTVWARRSALFTNGRNYKSGINRHGNIASIHHRSRDRERQLIFWGASEAALNDTEVTPDPSEARPTPNYDG